MEDNPIETLEVTETENGTQLSKQDGTGNQLITEDLEKQYILIPMEVVINAKICRLPKSQGDESN